MKIELRQTVLNAFRAEIPNISKITLTDSFLKMNLDSLSRTMIVFRIEEDLKGDFSDLDLFRCDSLEEICVKIENLKKIE